MENHKKTLGIIFVVSAVLQGIALLMLSFIVSTVLGFVFNQASPEDTPAIEFVMKLMAVLPGVIAVFFTLPTLIAGIGLLTNQTWALTMAMIVGCLKLFSFPIGTAIGIYAIWVYFEDKKMSGSANP